LCAKLREKNTPFSVSAVLKKLQKMQPTYTPTVPFSLTSFASLPGAVPVGTIPGQQILVGGKLGGFSTGGQIRGIGDMLDRTSGISKSGHQTHIPIIGSYIPDTWKNHYEIQQMPKDVMFAKRVGSNVRTGRTQMTNLAQVNEILRLSYQEAEDMRATGKWSPDVMIMWNNYILNGESGLEKEALDQMLNDYKVHALWAYYAKAILSTYSFLGVRINQTNAVGTPGTAVSIQTGGPTTFEEPWNMWGGVGIGDALFLVLKRRLDTATNKYREFQLFPVSSTRLFPQESERYYEDDGGNPRLGHVIKVGTVWQQPTHCPAPDVSRKKAGLATTATAAAMDVIDTISIVVGPQHRERECFVNG
jgi:hypothetical protein